MEICRASVVTILSQNIQPRSPVGPRFQSCFALRGNGIAFGEVGHRQWLVLAGGQSRKRRGEEGDEGEQKERGFHHALSLVILSVCGCDNPDRTEKETKLSWGPVSAGLRWLEADTVVWVLISGSLVPAYADPDRLPMRVTFPQAGN